MHFHRHLKLTQITACISLSKNYLFMHLTIVHVHCIKNYIKNKLIDNTNLFEHIVSQIIHDTFCGFQSHTLSPSPLQSVRDWN